jgi:hypothetical protein
MAGLAEHALVAAAASDVGAQQVATADVPVGGVRVSLAAGAAPVWATEAVASKVSGLRGARGWVRRTRPMPRVG